MTDHIFNKGYRTQRSTSLITISRDAKYPPIMGPIIPYRFSSCVQGNLFSQSNQSIQVPELSLECPMIETIIIHVDRGNSVPIKDITDISGLSTISGKESLTFKTAGVINL